MGEYHLKKCLDLFERETPLKRRDCGKYCSSLCCGGSADDVVFLFPGEKELLSSQKFEFLHTDANYGFDALFCGATCERKYRPLGCRIFPLFPLATKIGERTKITVVYDPRALKICPLLKNMRVISRDFVKAVKRAGEYMLLDSDLREYLLNLSEELREYALLAYKLDKS